jgi:uncharacterized protein (TIGR02391 family)
MNINYKVIAIEVGNLLKWDTPINEINRIAGALFKFRCEQFPNESITSSRAKTIYDWILTLAKQQMNPEERNFLLINFCRKIATEEYRPRIDKILSDNGLPLSIINKENHELFLSRSFHETIIKNSRRLFIQGNYFHAVFEAAKTYNKLVKEKSRSNKDGESLMLDVWGCEKGVLKRTPCQTETDKNIQDGIKFLSAGLMRAIRNPTSHEPAIDWPISRQDCLDILSFISFLFRQLDESVYFK